MLKRLFNPRGFILAFVLMCFATLMLGTTGCTGPNALVQQVQGERATVGKVIATATTVRDMVTAGLNADKIKAADAENIRAQVNVIRQGADVADGLVKGGNTTGADAKIQSLQVAIDALKAYLIAQGVKAP